MKRHWIDVLGTKLLPNTLKLAQKRGGDLRSALDAEECPTRRSRGDTGGKAVKYLERALAEFEKQTGDELAAELAPSCSIIPTLVIRHLHLCCPFVLYHFALLLKQMGCPVATALGELGKEHTVRH